MHIKSSFRISSKPSLPNLSCLFLLSYFRLHWLLLQDLAGCFHYGCRVSFSWSFQDILRLGGYGCLQVTSAEQDRRLTLYDICCAVSVYDKRTYRGLVDVPVALLWEKRSCEERTEAFGDQYQALLLDQETSWRTSLTRQF